MTDRDKLVKLIENADKDCQCATDCTNCGGYGKGKSCTYYHLADYLLANGVIVPPCKVGDTVYIVAEISQSIVECVVIGCWTFGNKTSIITDCGSIHNNSIGKTVFLTKEEAEEKLRGLKDNG